MALQSQSSSVKGEMNWRKKKLSELQAQNKEESSLFKPFLVFSNLC